MADATLEDAAPESSKKSGKTMIIMLAVAVLLGAGGFYATYSGMLFGPATVKAEAPAPESKPVETVVFITLAPLTISLGKNANASYLRFSGSLDVRPEAREEVETVTPRILDALNTYLRAVSESELEDPASMNRLRAQMLRRVQIVAGEGNVRDLLITEFVLK